MRLGKVFFERETYEVAQSLIGKLLIKYVTFFGQYIRLSGIITETEAYGYIDDPASHAYKGLTPRNRAMFGSVGTAYIYFIYGNHYCMNIVAKERGCMAGAVLIRSVEPLEGIGVMKILRRSVNPFNLASGPGKLTQAFGITKKYDCLDIVENTNKYFYLKEKELGKDFIIVQSRRIGITAGSERKWRFTMHVKEPGLSEYLPSRYLSKSS
jgi:DNA-3-methyladenine glycosylase